jgi:hypothetical protein
MYASPRGGETVDAPARDEIARLLHAATRGSDRLPLPLTPALWRERLLQEPVPDDRLAEAILGRRIPALVYYGLLGADSGTLLWLTQHPATLDHFRKFPGATAVFARSVRIKNGVVETPGDDSAEVWTALVGAPPSDPDAFIGRLLGARGGRLAFLFDTVMHLDAAHQKFALPAAPGESRTNRARSLLESVAESSTNWKIEERPFARPDVDITLLFRLVRVTDAGVLQGVTSRRIWNRTFGERDESSGSESDASIDAAWLAARVIRQSATVARERLDGFLLAQRVLDESDARNPSMLDALRGFSRYPALMLTLERCGVRGANHYAAAARMAAAVERDPESLPLAQGLLALIDGARRASTISTPRAAELIASFLELNWDRGSAPRLAGWLRDRLLPTLATASSPSDLDAESLAVRALAGPSRTPVPVVDWEGRRYAVDVAASERTRMTHIRRAQGEAPLGRAIDRATTQAGLRDLAQSLTALIYAVAIGDPDGPAVAGGPVWRRHRFLPEGPGGSDDTAWRIATESFGPSGWRLTGSLLALECAMPTLALSRLDTTTIPSGSRLSTSDRRTLMLTVALTEASGLRDADRAAIAAAVARGRERVLALRTDPDGWPAVARDARLSEWRSNAGAWLLPRSPAQALKRFTLAELYRLGDRTDRKDAWGAAASPLDGSLALRLPGDPWEEYAGRPGMGLLGSQLADVSLRTALALDELHLPAAIGRAVLSYAMQDVLDRAQPAHFDDFLAMAFAARDLENDRFEDYVAALTASGPLLPQAAAGGPLQ